MRCQQHENTEKSRSIKSPEVFTRKNLITVKRTSGRCQYAIRGSYVHALGFVFELRMIASDGCAGRTHRFRASAAVRAEVQGCTCKGRCYINRALDVNSTE